MKRQVLIMKSEDINTILDILEQTYPDAGCALEHIDIFELLICVVLSAQTTDKSVNKVTPALFAEYPDAAALSQADPDDVAEYIRSIGMYRTKSKNIVNLSKALVANYDGKVPDDYDSLVSLPGVGRKTANVVMCQAFGDAQGIAVDTHVFRIAHMLKLAGPSADTPAKTEVALLRIYPKRDWLYINHQWVHFGREYCIARRPKCAECFINDLCPHFAKLQQGK